MIDQAVGDMHVDLSRSYVIGDHARDVELAKRIGAQSILVTTGSIAPCHVQELKMSGVVPLLVVSSLTEATDWILSVAASRQAHA